MEKPHRGFKKCTKCQNTISVTDKQNLCLKCLGLDSDALACPLCQQMTRRGLKTMNNNGESCFCQTLPLQHTLQWPPYPRGHPPYRMDPIPLQSPNIAENTSPPQRQKRYRRPQFQHSTQIPSISTKATFSLVGGECAQGAV